MGSDGTKRDKGVVFSVSGRSVASFVIPPPMVAFIVCVALSVIYNFKESTSTHCGVANYLPSISAAIGGFVPQRYIWRICIALHSAPRLVLVPVAYYNYYLSFPVKSSRLYSLLVVINCGLNMMEVMALVALSMISSTENHDVHENSFIAFMVFSEMYMLLTCILYKWSHAGSAMSQKEKLSFRLKLGLFLFNISSFFVAVYFFFRHNRYCEPGVYTYFAFCEYMVVLSNMAFHWTSICELGMGRLEILGVTLPEHSKAA